MIAPSEKHLEDWIVRNDWAIPYSGGDFKVRQRQLPLPSGRLDLLGYCGKDIVVIEIKKEALDSRALAQILRYQHDLQRIWRLAVSGLPDPDPGCAGLEHLVFGFYGPQIKLILVGYSIADDILIATQAADVTVYLYDYASDEYTFNEPFKYVPNNEYEPYITGTTGAMMREAYLLRLMGFYSDDAISKMTGDRHAWDKVGT